MKTLKITISLATIFIWLFTILTTNGQIQFEGLHAEGQGGAGWNADGSGPEPYGNGHGDMFYYAASLDYLQGEDYCGAEMTNILSDFTNFELALAANGFTTDQVTLNFGLASLGDDVEGIDYFSIGGL